MKALSPVLLVVVMLCSFNCYSQKQGNIWYFGVHAGLDFNGGAPVPLTDGQTYSPNGSTVECSSIISDSAGHLLFYTNGNKIWDRSHAVMPNGTGLLSTFSSSQGALIVAKPGSSRYFYVFTVDDFYEDNLRYGFRYSMVDICLNDGFGDVMPGQKNIKLLDTVCEKLAAVRHANGTDYWILVHKYFSNTFYAYQLTASGITNVVTSTIGSMHPPAGDVNTYASIGQMKFSPNGQKLALVNGSSNSNVAEYFDFDNSTGTISNWVNLQTANTLVYSYYGVSFSPDNTKLYIAGDLNGNGIFQFDITAGGGNAASVLASKINIASANYNFFALQLGPDGKIYCTRAPNIGIPALDVINNPNVAGLACNYQNAALNLNGGIAGEGLPTMVTAYDYSNTAYICPSLCPFTMTGNQTICKGDSTILTFTGGDSINIIPPIGVIFIDSTHASLKPLTTTSYAVTAINACDSVSSLDFTVQVIDSTIDITASQTVICQNSTALVCAPSGYSMYHWSDNETSPCINVTTAGSYAVTVTQPGSCPATSAPVTITADSVIPQLTLFNSTLCYGDSAFATLSNGVFYSITPNSAILVDSAYAVLIPDTTTTYLFSILTSCGVYDTIYRMVNINSGSAPPRVVLSDSTLCHGDSAFATITNAVSYSITPNTAILIDSAHAVLAPDTTTTYLFRVFTSCSVYDTIFATVTVTVPVISIATSTAEICRGDSTRICAPSGYVSYNWNDGENTGCISITAEGNYYVTATDSSNCRVSSNSINISYYPHTQVDIEIHGDSLIAPLGMLNYQWRKNGTPVPGATSYVYVMNSGGDYTLQYTDTNGCPGVYNKGHVYTGIEASEIADINIFPNPTSTGWQLSVSNELIGSPVEVYDATGRLVFKSTIENQQSSVNFTNAASGVYQLRINWQGYCFVKKLVRL